MALVEGRGDFGSANQGGKAEVIGPPCWSGSQPTQFPGTKTLACAASLEPRKSKALGAWQLPPRSRSEQMALLTQVRGWEESAGLAGVWKGTVGPWPERTMDAAAAMCGVWPTAHICDLPPVLTSGRGWLAALRVDLGTDMSRGLSRAVQSV